MGNLPGKYVYGNSPYGTYNSLQLKHNGSSFIVKNNGDLLVEGKLYGR